MQKEQNKQPQQASPCSVSPELNDIDTLLKDHIKSLLSLEKVHLLFHKKKKNKTVDITKT